MLMWSRQASVGLVEAVYRAESTLSLQLHGVALERGALKGKHLALIRPQASSSSTSPLSGCFRQALRDMCPYASCMQPPGMHNEIESTTRKS